MFEFIKRLFRRKPKKRKSVIPEIRDQEAWGQHSERLNSDFARAILRELCDNDISTAQRIAKKREEEEAEQTPFPK